VDTARSDHPTSGAAMACVSHDQVVADVARYPGAQNPDHEDACRGGSTSQSARSHGLAHMPVRRLSNGLRVEPGPLVREADDLRMAIGVPYAGFRCPTNRSSSECPPSAWRVTTESGRGSRLAPRGERCGPGACSGTPERRSRITIPRGSPRGLGPTWQHAARRLGRRRRRR
jgi:hypothetical protein